MRRGPLLLVAAIVLVAGAVAAVYATREDDGLSPAASVRRVDVGRAPTGIAVTDDEVWVSNAGEQTVSRIDPTTLTVTHTVEVGPLPGAIAVAEGSVWVAATEGEDIHRIVPRGDRYRASHISVGTTPLALAVGERLWVTAFDKGEVVSVDLASGEPDPEPIRLRDGFPSAVAIGFGSVWVTDVVDDEVIRIDESSREVLDRIPVGTSPTAIAVGEGGVWVANFTDETVTHIDPETNGIVGEPIVVGGVVGGIAAGDGAIWVTRPEDGSIIRIDPATNEWTGEVFQAGERPAAVAVADGAVWVADQATDQVLRLVVDVPS